MDRVLQGRDPTFEDLEKLPYTHWVFNETLRLHPPVRSIPKVTTETVRLGGYKIPKGTLVSMNAAATHKHPKYWDKPEEFIPERFDESKNNIAPFIYYPFSVGRRNCIGKKFALIEAAVIIAMIAQRFEIEFDKGVEQKEYFLWSQGLTTHPRHSHLKLVFKKRTGKLMNY